MVDFSLFKPGDILRVKADFGVEFIGIYGGRNLNTSTAYFHCAAYDDMKELVYFSKMGRFCTVGFDSVFFAEFAKGTEVIDLYYKIVTQYEIEEPDLYKYFTDSTYFELKDWFTHQCQLIINDDFKYPKFVDEFVNYAWDVLCKKSEEFCPSPPENKMISLEKAANWVKNVFVGTFGEGIAEGIKQEFIKSMEE